MVSQRSKALASWLLLLRLCGMQSGKNSTFVSQGKSIKDMLKKFGMDDSKAISTPMGTSGSLDSDASSNMVDQKDVSVYDWKPTLCDRIKGGCDV